MILIYIIFFGLTSNKYLYRFISAISVIIYGITTAILGWKSGSIWALIIVVHLLFIINYFYKKQKKLKILFLIFIILTLIPVVFILSNNLRNDRNFVENISYDKIKSANSPEGGSKAQQWLDGFLKIPFSKYKSHSIIDVANMFKSKIIYWKIFK